MPGATLPRPQTPREWAQWIASVIVSTIVFGVAIVYHDRSWIRPFLIWFSVAVGVVAVVMVVFQVRKTQRELAEAPPGPEEEELRILDEQLDRLKQAEPELRELVARKERRVDLRGGFRAPTERVARDRACAVRRISVAVHPPLSRDHERFSRAGLRPGTPAAHARARLPLLPSGPDGVHRLPPRRTWPSTPLATRHSHDRGPRAGIQPRYSGLRVQGTAGSPPSTATRDSIAAARLASLARFGAAVLAEEVGFEPTGPLRAHALSRRADSAALALLRGGFYVGTGWVTAVRTMLGGEGGI